MRPTCSCTQQGESVLWGLLIAFALLVLFRYLTKRKKEKGAVEKENISNSAPEGRENEKQGIGPGGKRLIVVALVVAVGIVLWHKNTSKPEGIAGAKEGTQGTPQSVPGQADVQKDTPIGALPRLVDLGAGKCIPCKMMAPILEDMKKTYAGRMDVQFIDVWENPDASKKYGINLIPTQIFYDATGKERFRHEGFFSKDDILGKWKELGVDIGTERRTAK